MTDETALKWFGFLTRFWDWVDARDIDKHAVSVAVMYGTYTLTHWAIAFAALHPEKPGLEIAAIITAVTAPYMVLQGAAIKWYFDARAVAA